VRQWQTPDSGQFTARRQARKTERDELLLAGQAMHWATPKARDVKGGQGTDPTRNDLDKMAERFPSSPQDPLTTPPGPESSQSGQSSRRQWATPRTNDDRGGRPIKDGRRIGSDGTEYGINLSDQVRLTLDEKRRLEEEGARRLNPNFVEWLMGFPHRWMR